MQRIMFKSKIHRATITQAELHYEGSLTIDLDLMDAADLLPYEKVAIVNINNGERLETYVIPGDRGSKTICMNGAAARKGVIGDRIKAIEAAKAKGMTVVGLTGKDGGKMASSVDIEIRAPHAPFADRAQEIHIKVIHSLIDSIEVGLDYAK